MESIATTQPLHPNDPGERTSLTVSIVLEWENAILASALRSRSLLDRLREQIIGLPEQVELLVMYDPQEVDALALSEFIQEHLKQTSPGDSGVNWRLEAARDLHYYDLKNEGARRATGDLLVFVDSDVIPQPGWLNALVQPFSENPQLQVVTGNTWIDPTDIYGKAFAAGWFYGLPAKFCEPRNEPRWIWSNNVAYRRVQFLSAPYPEMPEGNTRDACFRQFQAYKQMSVPMMLQMAAEVSHPAPNGTKHFLLRGLAEGRDHFFSAREEVSPFRACIALLKRASNRITQAIYRCRSSRIREHMGLPFWQILPCLAVVCVYYSTYLLGAVIAFACPQRAALAWRI